jgi:hypothetical protein
MVFYSLSDFEKQLLYFKTRVETIVALEMGDKISATDAYKEIKSLMKDLKRAKKARPTDVWEDEE